MLKFHIQSLKIANAFKYLVVIICLIGNLLADGLPGEYYITQRWRDLLAGHSPATNPAFMTEENYIAARAAVCPTLDFSFFLMEFGVIVPIGLYQSIGASYLGLTTKDDIPEAKWDPVEGKIKYTGKMLNDNHSLFMLSYAINPWNRLSVGANINIFHETNFEEPRIGATFDMGLSYRFLRHSLLGDHVAGITFQNLLSPDFDFESWQTYSVNLKLSWLARIWEKRIEGGIDLDIKDFLAQSTDFVEGAEIEFDFNGRIGLWILRMINVYFQIGSEYLGVSGGINVPTVNNGRDFQVAYQYMSIVDDVALTSSHTFYFRGDFGMHREEIYARKMAELVSIGPGKLWNIANNHLAKGKYWDAFFVFGKILVEYPDFFKNDWVQLYMALCQEHLDMKEISTENYNKTKRGYPRSVVIPHADLGLMRIHYRDGNSSAVANQFAKLNASSVPDSLKYHAYYYMGETHLRDNRFKKAIQIFEQIPEEHPEYAFAQVSLAIAAASDNNVAKSLEALDNVVQLTPKSKAQEEIINRAFILIGYIYFEGLGGQERSLVKAISALRRVPAKSIYYEDALLGQAWTALRASNWPDCINTSKKLASISNKVALQCEAVLLEAYCYMIDQKYNEAIAILGPAFDKISKAKEPTKEEKQKAQQEYENNRGVYFEIGSMANSLALTSQSAIVEEQIDSLRAPQVEYENKLKDYYKFNDEFFRRKFFAKNIENVQADIEYALAKAEKMVGSKQIDKLKDDALKETEKLDEEMLKLQKELEELEGEQED